MSSSSIWMILRRTIKSIYFSCLYFKTIKFYTFNVPTCHYRKVDSFISSKLCRKCWFISFLWIVPKRRIVLGHIYELLRGKQNGVCWENKAIHQYSIRSIMGNQRPSSSSKLAHPWKYWPQRLAGKWPSNISVLGKIIFCTLKLLPFFQFPS